MIKVTVYGCRLVTKVCQSVLKLISSTATKVDGQGGAARVPMGGEARRDGAGCSEVARRWLGRYDGGQCHWPTAEL